VTLDNIALQPTVGAVAVLANRPPSALAPPSAKRRRYADMRRDVMASLLAVGVFAMLTVACPGPERVTSILPASSPELPIIQGPSYQGVVFPAETAAEAVGFVGNAVREHWTPSPSEIAMLESHLREALERGAVRPDAIDRSTEGNPQQRDYVARELRLILDHLAEFRRQYVGIITSDGAKRILVNCFPGQPPGGDDSFAYWRQRFVSVDDGGFWYWRIQYDMATATYVEFDSNGYA
jgi:hypothetical protein